MRKGLIIFIALLFTGKSLLSQSVLPGSWHGAMVREGSVQLINLHFIAAGDSLEVLFDDPGKGFYNCSVEELLRHQKIGITDSLFALDFGYGSFDLHLNKKDQEITGTNKEWKPLIRFHVKKVWEPVKQYYETENVIFKNSGISLAGTIYKPAGKTNCPYVILIHGSGNQTRSSLYISSLAYVLAQNGIGVLTFDKRGSGSSTGSGDASIFDLAEDGLAAVNYLLQRKDLNIKELGLLGTSQGGWIVPLIANKSENVSFIILNVGPAVSTFQQEIDRVKFSMQSENFPESTVDSAVAHTKLYLRVVRNNSGWNELERSIAQFKTRPWAADYLQLPVKMNDPDMIWWRENDYDPKNELSKLKCRVLSIMGAIDRLVPPQTNGELMETYLSEAKVSHKIIVYPDADHPMLTWQRLQGNEWEWPDNYWIWSKRPVTYYEDIINWILAKD